MGTQVTLNLPDEVMLRAERLSQLIGQPLESVLRTVLSTSLVQMENIIDDDLSILPDAEVLALVDLNFDADIDARMQHLMALQQQDSLSAETDAELMVLLYIYQVEQLKRARGLQEAVRRGLREQ